MCPIYLTLSKAKQTSRGNMSYHERRALVSLFSDIVIPLVYTAVILQRYPETDAYSADIFRFWGAFFLILIVVSIVGKIIIAIIFAIINAIATQEEESPITDERDRMIELKSTQYSLYVFAIGFMLGMGSLAFGMPPSTMFIILFSSGFLSQVVSDISGFYFYRRGV